MLSIKNLHVEVDGKEIIRGLDLNVNPGEVHAIMGPNGSGKSTLAHVLAGRDGYEVISGEVLYEGENLLDLAKLRPPFALLVLFERSLYQTRSPQKCAEQSG